MERILRERLPGGGFNLVTPAHRRIMQGVKGKGNRTTESRLRAALVVAGIRGWTLNARQITGCPDVFFQEKSVAIFVDGCFWHGCPACGHVPKKNAAFWEAKISRNRERDIQTTERLREQGVVVLRFWEHELRESLQRCVGQVTQLLGARQDDVHDA